MAKRAKRPDTSVSETEMRLFFALFSEDFAQKGPVGAFMRTVSAWRNDVSPIPATAHMCVGCGSLAGIGNSPVLENGISFPVPAGFRRWHLHRAMDDGADVFLASAWSAINIAAMFGALEDGIMPRDCRVIPAELSKLGGNNERLLEGACADMSVVCEIFNKAFVG